MEKREMGPKERLGGILPEPVAGAASSCTEPVAGAASSCTEPVAGAASSSTEPVAGAASSSSTEPVAGAASSCTEPVAGNWQRTLLLAQADGSCLYCWHRQLLATSHRIR